eukprot:6984168-Heterocapsa_arctica.AAC.1
MWSRTQPTITLSTTKSELMAVRTAVQESHIAQRVLEELGEKPNVLLHFDSSAAKALVARRSVGRLKHLAVLVYHVRFPP